MLQGKVALVTGGGGGIGQATCQVLAKEGAKVVVADINGDSAEATVKTLYGSDHCSIGLDVTKEASIDNLFKSVIEIYNSPPTVIVNSAGIGSCTLHFIDESIESMQQLFDVNYKGTFMITQRACQELKKHKLPGSIVNIASCLGHGYNTYVCYASTKAAVVCFSKGVGKEMAQFGIRCNAISPGGIDTEMLRAADKDFKEGLLNRCPEKRFGTPQEVAELILFLSSDKSSYINAANLDINGGM